MGASSRLHLALVEAVGDLDPAMENERRVAPTAVTTASRSPSRISRRSPEGGPILEPKTVSLWIWRWTVGAP